MANLLASWSVLWYNVRMKNIKNILNYIITGGIFLIPFIVFLVPQSMFFPFITGKGFTFRILIEIITGLFVVLAFMGPEYRPKMSWITKSVLFFTGAILLADLLGENPYKSLWSNYERMEGFVLIAHLLLYYIVASSVFNTAARWKQFFNVSILSSFLMSLYGVAQLLGLATINQGGVRVDATFGNSAYLAIYLVIHIFLCLYMLVHESKNKLMQWVYGLVGILEIVILYYTATRGAIIGFVGGLLLIVILILLKEKENKLFRKVSVWFIGALVILGAIFFLSRNTSLVKNSQVLSRFSSISLSEIKSQGRYYVWPMALRGVADRPIFGWGQENFNFVFNKYYDPAMYAQEQWFDRTHNVFLDWLIAGGIIGFLAYASMYLALFYYIWRKGSLLKLSEKSIFTGMIVAYIFHNIFVFDNLISYILFFSVLAYIHFVATEGVAKNTEDSKSKMFSSDVIAYVVSPIVAVATIIVVYFVNIPAISANQTLIQAISPQKEGAEKNLSLFKDVYNYKSFGSGEATEQLVQLATQINSSQLPDVLKQEYYEFAKSKVEEKVAEKPNDARYLMFAGSFYNRFGNYNEAIKYYDRALIESPKKQAIFIELGSAYLNIKNYSKALELLKYSYDLEPRSDESKIMYAVAGLYSKNTEVIKSIYSNISQDTVINDNRFLQAYAAIGDYNSVITILTLRLQNDPTNAQFKLSLASAFASIGQKQKAIILIQEIIVANPSFKDQGEQYIKQLQG